MSDSNRTYLRQLLVERYGAFVTRLKRVAGSKEGAADALHETWVRLETMTDAAPVANADAFLMTMATHIAVDRHRSEQRHVHEEEVEAALQIPDDLADPERILTARRQVDALKVILRGLTPRRRAILLAARVDGQLNRDIAERYGISLRLVERELSVAMKYCSARMEEMADPFEGNTTGRRKF